MSLRDDEVLKPVAMDRGVEGHPADSLIDNSFSTLTVNVRAKQSL